MFNFTSHFEESKIIAMLGSGSHECNVFMEVIWVLFVFYISDFSVYGSCTFCQICFVMTRSGTQGPVHTNLYRGDVLILLSTLGGVVRIVLLGGALEFSR